MNISKTSTAGKALVSFIGSSSRDVIQIDNLAAKVEGFAKIAPTGFPILFAGGEMASVVDSGADRVILGLVASQVKAEGKKESETVYRALLVSPLFSTDAILASGKEGQDWVAKIIEKETAHVQFRPIRNADEGEDLNDYAARVPTAIDALVTAAEREKIDVEALSILWPYFRAYVKGQKDSGNEVAAGTLRFLPGDKAIATVSKALRSADWARRNTSELESRGFWATIGQVLVNMAANPVPDPDNGASATRMVDASVIGEWLKTRDQVVIEPVVQHSEKDASALDAFMKGMAESA